jgi:hypothetical protein
LLDGAGLRATGIGEKGLACADVLGGPEGGDESLGFAGREAVTLCGVGEFELFGAGEAAQQGGECEREGARIEPLCQGGCEAAREQQAPLDPALLAVQQLADGCSREIILFDEGGDDPDLIHGTAGSGGAVRQ